MELHHIGRHSTPGHVRLFFYSEAAAKKVSQAGHVTLGVKGGYEIKLTPRVDLNPSQQPSEKPTWRYAIVSSNLPNADFARPSMLQQHLQLLCETASKAGTELGSKGKLQTPQPILYFHDTTGQILTVLTVLTG